MQHPQEFNSYSNNRQSPPIDGISDADSDQITRRRALDILDDDDAGPNLRERAQEALKRYEDQLQFGLVDESGR